MTKRILTQEYLKECLHYDPETGVFTWLQRPLHHFKRQRDCNAWNALHSGVKVGAECRRDGYLAVCIRREQWLLQRLAFFYMVGRTPNEVDHENHIRTDNRWANLLAVTGKINHKNMSMRSDNTSGHSGVSYDAKNKKWTAAVHLDGRKIFLGRHGSIEDAIAARNEAATRHGFHANHGAINNRRYTGRGKTKSV